MVQINKKDLDKGVSYLLMTSDGTKDCEIYKRGKYYNIWFNGTIIYGVVTFHSLLWKFIQLDVEYGFIYGSVPADESLL